MRDSDSRPAGRDLCCLVVCLFNKISLDVLACGLKLYKRLCITNRLFHVLLDMALNDFPYEGQLDKIVSGKGRPPGEGGNDHVWNSVWGPWDEKGWEPLV